MDYLALLDGQANNLNEAEEGDGEPYQRPQKYCEAVDYEFIEEAKLEFGHVSTLEPCFLCDVAHGKNLNTTLEQHKVNVLHTMLQENLDKIPPASLAKKLSTYYEENIRRDELPHWTPGRAFKHIMEELPPELFTKLIAFFIKLSIPKAMSWIYPREFPSGARKFDAKANKSFLELTAWLQAYVKDSDKRETIIRKRKKINDTHQSVSIADYFSITTRKRALKKRRIVN